MTPLCCHDPAITATVRAVTHEELQAALSRVDISADAAEAHGLLCGALCTREGYGAKDWLADLAADQGTAAPEADPALARLPRQVLEALRSEAFEFEPLLPADDAPLADRVAALAAWCGGFLYGIGTGSPDSDAIRSGEVGEYLRDLADIAHAGLEPERSTEAGEGDLFELVEFVRAGAQLVYEALAGTRSHAAG
jgi:uncharacterized protein YgfB (UPF0149 family)